MRRISRMLCVAAIAAAAMVFGFGAPASAATVIKVGHGAPEADAMHKGWVKFKEVLEAETGGRYQVEIFPNQKLGGDRELVEACQLGDVTMTSPSGSPLAAFVPDLYVLDIPFSFRDRAQIWAALDGELGAVLSRSIAKANLKNLGWWENGFRNLSNSKGPVRKPEDLDGLKIRTMENTVHLKAWKALGANPTPMAFGEVFTALQQGTVDGQENPYSLIYIAKFYEVQKYLSSTQHIFTPYVPVINAEFWEDLSEADRAAFMKAAEAAEVHQREAAKEISEASLAKIREAGVEVVDLTGEERAAFRKGADAAMSVVEEKVSAEAMAAFRSAIK